uniref:EGF-like domain-containing protein n=1 Tax=Chromera velia CCMP2878 TaxID=1169474 RepID=A0A0G4HGZ5_9ALVE|eukprot:Cvel_27371.t1-p1 / transcript=Cvel_27371.t1 / gene=Cvel_27371 / organism=Chromera_velia_CCMP2878 / gene_product=Sushi, von Willebrand factor type A, EGF and, putative / transcript_product=Sushi, von Willebrand factor type A, EGF and, putative / location=Cvel_scaffold3404:244-9904(-) / protein_length=938 / sequence_SO=supercontig / SO=protein_coding / is_pseudo=false
MISFNAAVCLCLLVLVLSLRNVACQNCTKPSEIPHGILATWNSSRAIFACNQGFALVGPNPIECTDTSWGPSPTCRDIDECALGLHNCAEKAKCSNTEGSFTCSCEGKQARKGDGRLFYEVGEDGDPTGHGVALGPNHAEFWLRATCTACPTGATCPGGFNDETTELLNSNSEWLEPLCDECRPGFTRVSPNNVCAICPSGLWNLLLVLFIIGVSLLVAVFYAQLTLQAGKNKKAMHAIVLKIGGNYLALLSALSTFDYTNLDWPDWSIEALNSFTLASVGDPFSLPAFDCLFRSEENEVDFSTAFRYTKMFVFLMPVVWPLCVTALMALVVVFYRRMRKEYLEDTRQMIERVWELGPLYGPLHRGERLLVQARRFMSDTIPVYIVTLFLMQVGREGGWNSVTTHMVQLIQCEFVNNERKFRFATSHDCDITDPFYVMGWLGILLWSIGIPVVACMVLFKHRKELWKPYVKRRYGFLTNGYDESFWFWESVVTVRRVLVVIAASFFVGQNSFIRLSFMVIVAVAALVLQLRCQPFDNRNGQILNRLENRALYSWTFTGDVQHCAEQPSLVGVACSSLLADTGLEEIGREIQCYAGPSYLSDRLRRCASGRGGDGCLCVGEEKEAVGRQCGDAEDQNQTERLECTERGKDKNISQKKEDRQASFHRKCLSDSEEDGHSDRGGKAESHKEARDDEEEEEEEKSPEEHQRDYIEFILRFAFASRGGVEAGNPDGSSSVIRKRKLGILRFKSFRGGMLNPVTETAEADMRERLREVAEFADALLEEKLKQQKRLHQRKDRELRRRRRGKKTSEAPLAGRALGLFGRGSQVGSDLQSPALSLPAPTGSALSHQQRPKRSADRSGRDETDVEGDRDPTADVEEGDERAAILRLLERRLEVNRRVKHVAALFDQQVFQGGLTARELYRGLMQIKQMDGEELHEVS